MRNPFWLGTPHMNTEPFDYEGMHIPKDTVIILNSVSSAHDVFMSANLTMETSAMQWTMHFNPERYPNPEEFVVSPRFNVFP